MTRTDLARLSRSSITNLNLLERGKIAPNLRTLRALAQALGVRVRDLLDDEAPPPPSEVSSKVFSRVVQQLRGKSLTYLGAVERVLKVLDEAGERVEK